MIVITGSDLDAVEEEVSAGCGAWDSSPLDVIAAAYKVLIMRHAHTIIMDTCRSIGFSQVQSDAMAGHITSKLSEIKTRY